MQLLRYATFLTKGHERSVRAKKNILASFLLKGATIALNLLLVPVVLNYLNPARYGIWLTLTSIIGWFAFFNLGLGNGLRNKFAEALAKNDRELARIYVSTTYAILAIIISLVYLAFIIINPLLNWTKILNSPPEMTGELSLLALWVFSFFCLRFVLGLITTILVADQRPALSDFLRFIENSLALLVVYTLTKLSQESSLLDLGIALSASPVIILIIASLFFFSKKYKSVLPGFRFVKLQYARDLTRLGIEFFIIQISGIIIFTTDNMIITQIFGPEQVTPYNIAHKYFSIVIMAFMIVVTPFWSAITDAYYKKDILWIKRIIRNLMMLWIMLSGMALLMVFASNIAYNIWIGDVVKIPLLLTIIMALYAVIFTWNNIFAYFLNGVGKIRLQLYSAVINSLINIPLSVFLAKNLNLGVSGVILATCFCLLASAVWSPVQYYKLINNKATGIWSR